ncbi:hypothetical protein H112_07205 [Trichophyton rubrum D6]|uniref:Uncharacterized protein n=2 Tax=Trichophyton TaxID=5550 RepID=A0A022VT42_TRIRU|nr:hypothetical protein H100_07230 [Trichophyton rubrum MR850]EZF38560.1 hypothetical protein H102_07190 [Trichophyton rubrum CBS 100081]EZF49235.1 hypothetical protein H103_07214 [Trichophyton rubrum CBS 288.86]EZF59878.1 hypothetical protein H104_07167 [Trichophyton rubrum CBS 289.86]EZF70412.1 hypothetical protein H105_07226 [Trichophyton soudanense CBS 452.61]EZF81224.1 hypothetical protein H110_07212 [Trichophyton rubrum MR1448]EZF91774.1 hypothetical protein H113_07267 [Trichophyton rub
MSHIVARTEERRMLPGRRRAGSSPFALEAVRCETRQGAKAKETKRDKDLRRRMLHGCEQMRPSLVSILQIWRTEIGSLYIRGQYCFLPQVFVRTKLAWPQVNWL